jgi:predicted ATP-dependent protease
MPEILLPQALGLTLNDFELGFADTSQLLAEHVGWIGQARAEKAARFGLALDQAGYNLFVLGEVGCGRSSLLFRAMQEEAARRPPAPDLVYLHNFEQPERPLALRLNAGQGAKLRNSMGDFARNIARDIPRKLDEESVRRDCERARKTFQEKIEQAYNELNAVAAAWHFVLRREDGRLVFTLIREDGQVMQEDAVLAMPAVQRAALEEAEQGLRVEIAHYLEKVRPIEREMEQQLAALRRAAVEPVVQREVGAVRQALSGSVVDEIKFAVWLQHLSDDVLDKLEAFSPGRDDDDDTGIEALLSRYRVNVVVDNGGNVGAPVLRADDPVFRSLFGGIEYQAESGILVTDFMRIRAGDLLRAHGGFLMLHLRDVVRDPQVWEKLQRLLRSGRLQIEEPTAAFGQLATTTLEPEPVDVRVKLVLIGTREDYYDLHESDTEFASHFRVKVDFAESFPANAETRHATSVFIAQRCQALGLPHFTSDAVARLLVFMQREIDDQHRMSSIFGRLESLMVECAAFCRIRCGNLVNIQDVQTALADRLLRHNYPEQVLLESIVDGELMISVHGREIGQINGLTQADLGDFRFGSPVRISARAYAGEEGVVNIDREVEMTGPNHDKGVMILSGWLSATFSSQAPLCLSASLVFEQEYHGVEGDSASCAELYALLSALSGLPLPQGIAVTGALNQHGEVMPIGGVNEKIEGYFRTCQKLGPEAGHGVIIPARNRQHLLLDAAVVQAVERGEFSIYTISHVLEGIELLTGVPAGSPDASGNYRQDTVLGRAQRALEGFRKACDASGHHHEREHG